MSQFVARLQTYVWLAVVHFLFATTALIGLLAVPTGMRIIFTGDEPLAAGLIATTVGSVALAVGLGFYYVTYVKAPLWAAQERRIKARYPNQPWMLRADWARRKSVHSSAGVAIFLWVWVIGWWSAIILIWTVNRDKILAAAAASYWEAALGLLFPLGGLIGLAIACQITLSWWRYGRSELHIDTLPGWIGDVFRAGVITNLPTRPKKPVEVELVCERVTWVTLGSGENRRAERRTEHVWATSAEVLPSQLIVSKGRVGIPVVIKIDPGVPPTESDERGNGFEWSLSVSMSSEDAPGFSCAFEVPVFERT